jgi:hypothetical protein
MSGPDGQTADSESAARRRGRSEGMATAAVALGVVAFLNLLGTEKGILAIVLAVLSLRNLPADAPPRRARIAIALGVVQLATVVMVLVLFHDKLRQLIELLRTLG